MVHLLYFAVPTNNIIYYITNLHKKQMVYKFAFSNIKILKEKGIIERVGSTKNGIWKINIVE